MVEIRARIKQGLQMRNMKQVELADCILQTPTDGFAEQNGRVAERADCLNYS